MGRVLEETFHTHRLSDSIRSDNGPQFVSQEFSRFSCTYGFVHTTSSPHLSQANGEAERAVQTARALMQTPDPSLALSNYRATPHSTTFESPAEALMGRKLKTRVSTLTKNLLPSIPDAEVLRATGKEMKENCKANYDRGYGAKRLSPM